MIRWLPPMILLPVAACGGDRDVASGSATDAGGNGVSYSVKQNGDATTTTIRSADGTATIRTGDHVAALPAGLAVYPGANVTSSMSMDGEGAGKGGTVLAFESADTPDRIVAFYRSAAERAGYRIDSEITAGAMSMVGGKRGEGDEGFSLTVNRAGEKSEATLVAGR